MALPVYVHRLGAVAKESFQTLYGCIHQPHLINIWPLGGNFVPRVLLVLSGPPTNQGSFPQFPLVRNMWGKGTRHKDVPMGVSLRKGLSHDRHNCKSGVGARLSIYREGRMMFRKKRGHLLVNHSIHVYCDKTGVARHKVSISLCRPGIIIPSRRSIQGK